MTGQTISHYRILDKLGEGGMGVVYKAEDLTLGRIVALKFLSAAGEESKTRFLREARAAAALHHPNICTVFEIDEASGLLAMEFVDGITLKHKIAERPFKLEEALDLARQIGDGLQVAHEKGVTHRDIKPANIMVTPRGVAKIMDFGLARLGDRTRITRTGMSMGTPAYMSPEQAKGEDTDRRTDIWSFGVVLYEMLAGRVPFGGESEAAVARAILDDQPEPLTALRTGLPVELDRIISKVLAKSPGQRYQNVEDLLVDLRHVKSAPPAFAPRRSYGPWAWAAPGMLVGAAVAWLAFHAASPAAEPAASPTIVQLTTYDGTEREAAISPDGRRFAFVWEKDGQPDIWVRQVSGGEPVRITNDTAFERQITYSPDGESIYYTAADGTRGINEANFGPSLWMVSALGGTARRIVESGSSPSFSSDGKILAYVQSRAGLFLAGPRGASPKLVAKAGTIGQQPVISPDGKSIAVARNPIFGKGNLFLLDPESGTTRALTNFEAGGVYSFDWLPGGEGLVYSKSMDESWPLTDTLDLGITTLSGQTRKISLNVNSRLTLPSVSDDGKRMVATMETFQREIWRVPLSGDPKANARGAVKLVDSGEFPIWHDVSRKGNLMVYNSPAAGRRNFWALDLNNPARARQLTQLTEGVATHAAWSPDESMLAYTLIEKDRSDLWVMNADGSNLRRLTDDPEPDFYPTWSPDGKWILFYRGGLWKVPVEGGKVVKISDTGYRADWSPSGDRIAATDDVTGAGILDAATGKKLRALNPSPYFPIWSPDGKKIAAIQNARTNEIYLYDPETGEGKLAVEFPKDFNAAFKACWTADGKSLIISRQDLRSHIVLLENFR